MDAEKKENESIWLNNGKIIVIVLVVIGFIIGISGVLLPVDELSNNVTLVVEVGVGIIVTIIIFRSTKQAEFQNQSAIEEMKNLVKEVRSVEEKQNNIIDGMKNLVEEVHSFEENEKFEKEITSLERKQKIYKALLNILHKLLQTLSEIPDENVTNHPNKNKIVQILNNIDMKISDMQTLYKEHDHINDLESIVLMGKDICSSNIFIWKESDDDQEKDVCFLRGRIDNRINELNKLIENYNDEILTKLNNGNNKN